MKNWKRWLGEYATLLLIWVGLIGLFSLGSDRFFRAATFANLHWVFAALLAGSVLVYAFAPARPRPAQPSLTTSPARP